MGVGGRLLVLVIAAGGAVGGAALHEAAQLDLVRSGCDLARGGHQDGSWLAGADHDTIADAREDIMAFRDIYKVPEGPIETEPHDLSFWEKQIDGIRD